MQQSRLSMFTTTFESTNERVYKERAEKIIREHVSFYQHPNESGCIVNDSYEGSTVFKYQQMNENLKGKLINKCRWVDR